MITLVLVAALAVATPRLAERSTDRLAAPTGERWRAELGTQPSFRFMNLGTGVPPTVAMVAGEEGVYVADDGLVAAYDATTGSPRWQRVLPAPRQPHLVGPVVVVDSAQGVVALDRETGEVRWQDPVPGVDRVTSDGHERIYLSRSTDLAAVRAADGTVAWRTRSFPGPDPGFLAADRDTVVLATTGSATIRAVDAATGRTRWQRRFSGEVLSPPVLADGHVYVQDGSGALLAYDARTGDQPWAHATHIGESGPLAAGSGVVVRWTASGGYVALHATTGLELWRRGGRTFQSGLVHDGLLLLPERNSRRLHAIDARSGAERWERRRISPSALAASGDTLYVSEGGEILALDAGDGTERWRVEPSDPNGVPGYPTPTADGERLYVTTVGGPLVALDRDTGTERWRFDPAEAEDELPTDSRTGITSVAVPFAERVIVTSNRAVYALDARTGRIVDRFQTSVGPGAVPVVTQGMIVVDLGPSVVGLEAASFHLRWQWTAPAGGAHIGSHPVTAPTVHGDVVLVGGGDGTLAALDPLTGAARWDLDLGAAVISRPAVSGNTIVVRTETGDVRAFDADSGRARWRKGLSPTGLGDPAVHDDTVYATDAGQVIALDVPSGIERWRTDVEHAGLTAPLVVDDVILVGTDRGELVAIDGSAGGVLWRHRLEAPVPAPPAVVDDGLVVVTGAGTVVSLD